MAKTIPKAIAPYLEHTSGFYSKLMAEGTTTSTLISHPSLPPRFLDSVTWVWLKLLFQQGAQS